MAYEGMKHLLVVIAFHEAESAIVFVIDLIVSFIDQSHDAANRLAVPVCQQQNCVSVAERFVLLSVEELPFIHINRWQPFRFVSVNLFRQIDELTELFPSDNFFDCYFAHVSQVVRS